MPRPRRPRWVRAAPPATFYKPQGIPLDALRGAVLPIEGLEALKLVDAEGLDHESAAALMGVSRPTLSRLLAEARRTVATALGNGWALRIDGGDFRLAEDADAPRGSGRGRGGGHGMGRGRGRRGGRGFAGED